MNKVEESHVKRILDNRETVCTDSEHGIIHDHEHGGHTEVRAHYLDADEWFACRRCFGYPDDAQLEVTVESESPGGQENQETLAGWSA